MIAGIAVLDHLSGFELSFSIFYVIPVAIAAWNINLPSGVLFSIFSGAIWSIVDYTSGHNYSNGFIPIWNGFVRLLFFLIISYLLTEMKRGIIILKTLSDTDSLTGILNGRGFEKYTKIMIAQPQKKESVFSLAYLDIDNFKNINDKLGHSSGDLLLTTLAKSIRDCVRDTDIVARIGGDEFVVLLCSRNYEESDLIMNRMKEHVDIVMKKNNWPVSLSIGIVSFLSNTSELDSLLYKADELMYKVKNTTKNGIVHQYIK